MERLLKLRFSNGTMMLPFYRYQIIINQNSSSGTLQNCPQSKSILQKLHVYWSLLSNIKYLFYKKRRIVYITSTLFNVKDELGKYYNSLDGYYYDLYKDNSLMIENSDENYKWRKTQRYPNTSYILTYLSFISAKLSLLYKIYPIRPKYISDGDYKLLKIFNLNKDRIRRQDMYVTIYTFLVKKLLSSIKPKVIFCNCACYGDNFALIMKVANDLGIRTIELQHGAITSGHEVYNCDNIHIVNNEEFRQYLPKEIWLFGNYWKNNITFKIKKLVVGNPHIDYFSNKLLANTPIYDYLFISQPDTQCDILSFINNSKELLINKKILIRIHPLEDKKYYLDKLTMWSNIKFSDSTTNLYDDIISSNNIIGVYSTCLYEALFFNKNIIVIDCQLSRKYFDINVGLWSKNLYNIEGNLHSIQRQKQEIWAINFEKNVRKYLQEVQGSISN